MKKVQDKKKKIKKEKEEAAVTFIWCPRFNYSHFKLAGGQKSGRAR